MTRKRIEYLDSLRVVATFAVIIIHVAAQNWYSQAVYTFEWRVFNFYDSISRWAVPAFVMISGALMLEKDISLNKLYTKKILRYLLAFAFWSVIYTLFDDSKPKVALISIIGGKYHLWFIYLIVGLYICIPVIKKIVETTKIAEYYLSVSFVFSFLIPFVLQIMLDFGGAGMELWVDTLKNVYDDMNISFANGYVAYFVGGYYLSKISIDKPKRMAIYSAGVLGTAATIFLSAMISVEKGMPVSHYYEYLSLNVFVQSVAVFVWFKYNVPFKAENSLRMKKLTKYCFGVYVVHIIIMELFEEKLLLHTLTFNPIISVPVIALVIFIVSCAISVLLNRTPVVKEYAV